MLAPFDLASSSAEFARDRDAATEFGVLGAVVILVVLTAGWLGLRASRWFAWPSPWLFLIGYTTVQLYVFHDAIRAAWH